MIQLIYHPLQEVQNYFERRLLGLSSLKQDDRIRSIMFHVINFTAIKINFGGKTKPGESYSK